jgi:hypothetical protein
MRDGEIDAKGNRDHRCPHCAHQTAVLKHGIAHGDGSIAAIPAFIILSVIGFTVMIPGLSGGTK